MGKAVVGDAVSGRERRSAEVGATPPIKLTADDEKGRANVPTREDLHQGRQGLGIDQVLVVRGGTSVLGFVDPEVVAVHMDREGWLRTHRNADHQISGTVTRFRKPSSLAGTPPYIVHG